MMRVKAVRQTTLRLIVMATSLDMLGFVYAGRDCMLGLPHSAGNLSVALIEGVQL